MPTSAGAQSGHFFLGIGKKEQAVGVGWAGELGDPVAPSGPFSFWLELVRLRLSKGSENEASSAWPGQRELS